MGALGKGSHFVALFASNDVKFDRRIISFVFNATYLI